MSRLRADHFKGAKRWPGLRVVDPRVIFDEKASALKLF